MGERILNRKILFITPPYHAGVLEVAGRWVPLYLVYLSGAARKAGWEPVVYDAMGNFAGYREIEQTIRDVNPDVVGVGAITSTINDALNVVTLVKSVDPAIKTVLGGVHPTFMYEEILSDPKHGADVDFVVRGEGEATLTELLGAVERGSAADGLKKIKGLVFKEGGQTIVTAPRPLAKDIDTLPVAWDVLDWPSYTYYVMPGSRLGAISTSRGCEQDCTFCSQQKLWEHSWRSRKPEKIVAELVYLQQNYGLDVVLFTDEDPVKDRDRFEKLLDLMIEADLDLKVLMETRADNIVRDKDILWKWRKAGIIHIYVGIENIDQDVLNDTMKKGITVEQGKEALRLLDEHGILSETSFILGLPEETPESIAKTLRISLEFNPDMAHYVAICPWPYCDIYSELKDRIEVTDYSQYNLVTPIVKPDNMTLRELDEEIIVCYKTFYMGKMAEVLSYKDKFKREYMLSAFKRIMLSPFIQAKMGSLGKMPKEMAEEMSKMMPTGKES